MTLNCIIKYSNSSKHREYHGKCFGNVRGGENDRQKRNAEKVKAQEKRGKFLAALKLCRVHVRMFVCWKVNDEARIFSVALGLSHGMRK